MLGRPAATVCRACRSAPPRANASPLRKLAAEADGMPGVSMRAVPISSQARWRRVPLAEAVRRPGDSGGLVSRQAIEEVAVPLGEAAFAVNADSRHRGCVRPRARRADER